MRVSSTTAALFPLLLASTSLALPQPKKDPRSLFRPIREREYAGGAYPPGSSPSSSSADAEVLAASAAPSSSAAASYTGIPVVAASLNPADYLPAATSGGKDTVPPSASNIPSESVSSLLAATTAFETFSYTGYVVPASTSTSTTSAVYAQSTGGSSSGDSAYDQAISAAEAYAKSMMGTMMPTLTLELVLSPTQVRLRIFPTLVTLPSSSIRSFSFCIALRPFVIASAMSRFAWFAKLGLKVGCVWMKDRSKC